MRKKLGLALGSGGARGIAHIGFLQALDEVGLRADYVSGCSMGAIVGACYCAGVPIARIRETALSLRLSRIASLNIAPLQNNGIFRLNKAKAMLQEIIQDRTFEELEIPFSCVAVDLKSGKLIELKTGSVADAAIASGSIPGVFTPASAGGYTSLVDGGILERVPTNEVRHMGAEVVVAVDVLGNLMVKEVGNDLVGTLLRCIDIMDTRSTQRKRRSRASKIDLWLEPELGTMDQYRVKNLSFAYEKGYELGIAHREEIADLLEE